MRRWTPRRPPHGTPPEGPPGSGGPRLGVCGRRGRWRAGRCGTASRPSTSAAAPAGVTSSAGCCATARSARSPTRSTSSCAPAAGWCPSALGWVTTSHAVVQEVLRSEHFGVGFDRAALPRLVPLGARVRRRAGRLRRGGAAVHAGHRPAGPHPLPPAGEPRLHAARHRRLRADDRADDGGPARRARAAPRRATARSTWWRSGPRSCRCW